MLNFREILDLDFDEYGLLFRDAYIYKLQQTEQGRDYLENCYILEQSKPDRKKLKNTFGRE